MKLNYYKIFIFLFINMSFSQINKVEYSIKMDIENKFNRPLENVGILYFNNKESTKFQSMF